MGEQQYLYRLYDCRRVLLYVGITNSVRTRFAQHRVTQPWWGDVQYATAATYSDRPTVEAAERRAIVFERPRYNVTHKIIRKDRPMSYERPVEHAEIHPDGLLIDGVKVTGLAVDIREVQRATDPDEMTVELRVLVRGATVTLSSVRLTPEVDTRREDGGVLPAPVDF